MAQAAVADVVAPRERGRYQGYMASMWGVSSIAGPILGGWATDHLSWRWIFWVNLPVGLVAFVLCDRALRMIRTQRRKLQIDLWGAVLLVLGVTAWLLMLSWGGVEMPWLSVPVAALALLGVAMLALLVWQERRVADPILPPRLFGNPTFLRGVLIAFFTSLGLFGATFLLPLYFQLAARLRGGDLGADGHALPRLERDRRLHRRAVGAPARADEGAGDRRPRLVRRRVPRPGADGRGRAGLAGDAGLGDPGRRHRRDHADAC